MKHEKMKSLLGIFSICFLTYVAPPIYCILYDYVESTSKIILFSNPRNYVQDVEEIVYWGLFSSIVCVITFILFDWNDEVKSLLSIVAAIFVGFETSLVVFLIYSLFTLTSFTIDEVDFNIFIPNLLKIFAYLALVSIIVGIIVRSVLFSASSLDNNA